MVSLEKLTLLYIMPLLHHALSLLLPMLDCLCCHLITLLCQWSFAIIAICLHVILGLWCLSSIYGGCFPHRLLHMHLNHQPSIVYVIHHPHLSSWPPPLQFLLNPLPSYTIAILHLSSIDRLLPSVVIVYLLHPLLSLFPCYKGSTLLLSLASFVWLCCFLALLLPSHNACFYHSNTTISF